MDTKNTMEVLDSALVLVEQYKAAMANGQIDVFDIPKLVPVMKAIRSAVEGGSLIPSELKELDDQEIEALFAKITEVVDAIISLVTK
jgi:hypothetical protein